ncbi:polyketide cyclase [Halomonas urumqiensis]|uniref:Polyketide cyclase n=1 Tax=Halomonas urumqiensis TaxID=1684789 RepID=A0A2N7UCD0_9GAMM|nr:cyclase family protein [Halomonas urumqiensis]PMR78099.1 polyketide cyclase [Halomonas urumqiensis]
MDPRWNLFAASTLVAALTTSSALAAAPPDPDHQAMLENSRQHIPLPPWPNGDQAGMGNTQGAGTWQRCAFHMARPDARTYELSHVRSANMPQSPFAAPASSEFDPTSGIPGTRHGFNTESVSGNVGGQGTQLDALGHFGHLATPWDGQGEFPADELRYYGGLTQDEVKPSADAPLSKLGVEHVPPIVTSAVLLDASEYLNEGEPLAAGTQIDKADIQGMIEAQGLGWRGLQPGDVLYVHTGWGSRWDDENGIYYGMGPGLDYDTMAWLAEQAIVLVALDNPFTDPVPEGMLSGESAPQGVPDGLPFAIHHHNLTQSGIYQIQNANLGEMARDNVWTSCTMILPNRTQGAAQAPVRPIAIGSPTRP